MERKEKKISYILNIIFIILIMVGDICYITFGGTWLKGLTSALFVLLGTINLYFAILFKGNIKFCSWLLAGLFFAMLGDILLNIHFITGAIFFAVGHIFFFVSYCFLQKFKWQNLIYGLAIFIPSLLIITLVPIFDFNGILMEIICIVYALIISLMVGKSISNFVNKKSVLNILILIGSGLFFFSDLMLLLNVFGGLPKIIDILCLLTYYPAEILLAHSILHSKQN